MDVWLIWLILAVVLGVAEILTLTAALGMLGAAALITSVAAAVGFRSRFSSWSSRWPPPSGSCSSALSSAATSQRPSVHVFGPAAHAGKTAQVVREIRRESGRVRIDGEEWTARTYDEALVIPVGAIVDVLGDQGVIALVYPRE